MATTISDGYAVHFPKDMQPIDEHYMPMRGYCEGVTVELADGTVYPLYFYDPTRVKQTVEHEARSGRGFYTEPGLVVLPEVTVAAIREAVPGLLKSGFFDHLRPLPAAAVNGSPR